MDGVPIIPEKLNSVYHEWPAYMLSASRDGWQDIADQVAFMCRALRERGADPTTFNISTEHTLTPHCIVLMASGVVGRKL